MVSANRRLARVCLFLACWLVACAAAAAADVTVVDARGTSLRLAGDKWVEMADGETVPDGRVLRTLHNGRILLGVDGSFIHLAGDTAVRVSITTNGVATVVHLYAGSVDVEAAVDGGRISVATPVMLASADRADYSVTVGDQLATVRAISGVVVVSDVQQTRSTAIEAGREVAASLSAADGGGTAGSGSSGNPAVPGSAQAGTHGPAPGSVPGQDESTGRGGPSAGGTPGGNPDRGNGQSNGDGHGAAGGHGGGNGAGNGNEGKGESSSSGGSGNATKGQGGGNGNGN